MMEQKNIAGMFKNIHTQFFNRLCPPHGDLYAGDVMLHYLRPVKKPRKMAPRDFALRKNQMLQHTEFLETHYESKSNEARIKLMYMRVQPKSYHQKFIAQGKNFKLMYEQDIMRCFKVIH